MLLHLAQAGVKNCICEDFLPWKGMLPFFPPKAPAWGLMRSTTSMYSLPYNLASHIASARMEDIWGAATSEGRDTCSHLSLKLALMNRSTSSECPPPPPHRFSLYVPASVRSRKQAHSGLEFIH